MGRILFFLKTRFSAIRNRPLLPRLLILGGLLGLTVALFFLLMFVMVWTEVLGPLPGQRELILIEHPVASEIYSSDSVLLGRFFIQERSNVRYEELPSHVISALLATEDIRYYEHSGIDFRSVGRVVIKSLLLQNDDSGGGSTISQQLAKNLYPRQNYLMFSLLINKLREIIIAARLEKAYDKPGIITLYLNTIPFGENTFGIESASQRFFSRHARDLTMDQAAVLIGMLKATNYYNPRLSPERAMTRRNTVLSQMKKYEMVPSATIDSVMALPLGLNYNRITHHLGLAPYFREYLREAMLTWCSGRTNKEGHPLNLYTAGLKIYTTIDSRLQQYAELATSNQMAGLQNKFSSHWKKKDPWEDDESVVRDAVRKSDHYRSLKRLGIGEDSIMRVMNQPVAMNVFSWEGEKQVTMTPVDSVKHYLKFLNAGFLAIDPKSGAIRAWVGGINHQHFQFDHVRETTKRQVGSTIKPLVYASALEQGIRPCEFISAEKIVYTNMEGWAPENTQDNYGLKYSLVGGLTYSVNTVSVRVLEKTGIANTISLFRKMGISSPVQSVPSIALGTPDISVMEMVAAYACFANSGKYLKPHYLTSITSHDNLLLEEFIPSPPVQAVSPETADMMAHILKRVIDEGTGSALRTKFALTNDIAGKTGTTQSNADGWFIAITPGLVAGAWVGADDPRIRFRSTSLGQGAATALPIVGEFFQQVNKDTELRSMAKARFPELSPSLQRKISCVPFKEDKNIFKQLFGNKNKEKKRDFNEKKKEGFFKRLFKKHS